MPKETLFIVNAGHRKPANKLEAHLLATAQAWCHQECIVYLDKGELVQVDTMAQFYAALSKERTLYCLDNPRSTESSISLTLISATRHPGNDNADCISVRPSSGDLPSTFMICLTPQTPS